MSAFPRTPFSFPQFNKLMYPRIFSVFSVLGVIGLACWLAVSAQAQSESARPKLVMLIAENEYETATTLPAFAAEHLATDFRVVAVQGSSAAGAITFESMAAVRDADVLLVSVRRRPLPPRAARRHPALCGIRSPGSRNSDRESRVRTGAATAVAARPRGVAGVWSRRR